MMDRKDAVMHIMVKQKKPEYVTVNIYSGISPQPIEGGQQSQSQSSSNNNNNENENSLSQSQATTIYICKEG
jgi:hypothetical protein